MTRPKRKSSVKRSKRSDNFVAEPTTFFTAPVRILLAMLVVAIIVISLDEYGEYREKVDQQEWTFHHRIATESRTKYLILLRTPTTDSTWGELRDEYNNWLNGLKTGKVIE